MQIQLLNPYQGNFVSAKNAREDLDIDTILAGCSQVEEQVANLDYSIRNMNMVKNNFTDDSISIDGTNVISTNIDDYSTALENTKNSILNSVQEIRVYAVNRFNAMQDVYNNLAISQEEQMANQE